MTENVRVYQTINLYEPVANSQHVQQNRNLEVRFGRSFKKNILSGSLTVKSKENKSQKLQQPIQIHTFDGITELKP